MNNIVLLFGSNGWIGKKIKTILQNSNFKVIEARSRLDNYESLKDEIMNTEFDYCFLCAGITRDPKDPGSNIDWCENNKLITHYVNSECCFNLIKLCVEERKKKVVYFGTGCIYEYDNEHVIGGKTFTEDDTPNFTKSTYSNSKADFERRIARYLDDVLVLRFRMPIDSYLSPRNIITKLIKYDKIINIPNSMSVLDDLLPLVPDMLHLSGIYNFVNPGTISHNQLLDLYIEHVDPNFKYTNFTLDEQYQVVKAPRSNVELDCSKLLGVFPDLLNIVDSVREVMKRIKINEAK